MIKIELEKTNNGIIKTTYDDNVNGNGSLMKEVITYELKHKGPEKVAAFFEDLCADMNLEFDDPYQRLHMEVENKKDEG